MNRPYSYDHHPELIGIFQNTLEETVLRIHQSCIGNDMVGKGQRCGQFWSIVLLSFSALDNPLLIIKLILKTEVKYLLCSHDFT